MTFNKNQWTRSYEGTPGIKRLGAQDAVRKGYQPKTRQVAVKPGASRTQPSK